MVKRNELDEGPLPAAEVESVANQYGVNKTRFWVKRRVCLGVARDQQASGTSSRGNAADAKGDQLGARPGRTYAGVARRLLPAGTPWTHLLPPGYAGSITKRNLQPYPPRAEPREGESSSPQDTSRTEGSLSISASGTINPAQAEVVKRDLINLGFDRPTSR